MLFMLNNNTSLICSAVVTLLAIVWAKWYFFSYYIPGIPIMKANSILGYATTIPSKKGKFDSHLTMMKEAETTGKIFQYYYLNHLIVFVSDKYISKYVLEHVTDKGFFHRGNPKINPRSVFNLNTNAEWKVRRNAFRPSFTMLALKNFQPELKLLSKKVCAMLRKVAQEKSVIEIDKLFGLLTVDVICSIAFQYDINALDGSELYEQLHEDIRARFESNWMSVLPFADVLYNSPLKGPTRYRKANKRLKDFCLILLDHVRKQHKEGTLKKESFAHALVELSQVNDITEDDLCHDILTMFIAGHETTAHTLSFFVYGLATHPEVQTKCHAAMDESTATQETNTSTSTMALLPAYVEANLKESMRKYPVANRGSSRLVNEDKGVIIPMSVLNKSDPLTTNGKQRQLHFTKDILLPKNSWVHVYIQNVQVGESNWGNKANDFIPERFLPTGHYTGDARADTSVVNSLSSPAVFGGGGASSDDLMFTPFSYGMRNCIGMNLALMELRVVIADLVKEFSFTLADESMRDENIAMETVFTLRPHKMLPVYVSVRK